MSLIVKNKHFNSVVLAPMAGVTDGPFREIVRQFGDNLLFTEMILAKFLIHNHGQTSQMAKITETEKPVAIQFVGNNVDVLKQATEIVKDRCDLLNINMGCPVHKIVKSGCGCALMQQPELAEKIVRSLTDCFSIPISVKIRLGWDENCKNYVDFSKRMEQAGASLIVLHARTKDQMYSGEADWKAWITLKESLSIPVVANGNITSKKEADNLIKNHGLDGVMIGRYVMGRPWALKEIEVGRDKLNFSKIQVILDHLNKLKSFYGEKAVFIARKHLAWYSVEKEGGADFRRVVNSVEDFDRLVEISKNFFEKNGMKQ